MEFNTRLGNFLYTLLSVAFAPETRFTFWAMGRFSDVGRGNLHRVGLI